MNDEITAFLYTTFSVFVITFFAYRISSFDSLQNRSPMGSLSLLQSDALSYPMAAQLSTENYTTIG